MSITARKELRFAGLRVELSADAARAERVRRSKLYRYLLRPGLKAIAGSNGGASVSEAPAVATPSPAQCPQGADAIGRQIWERVSGIGWYHTIDLGHGVVTPGFIDNRQSVPLFGLPEDLSGKRCLDIGTYDGFWAFEMERRGASEVLGIDVDSPLDHDIPRRARERALREMGDEHDRHRALWNQQLSSIGIEYPGQGFQTAKELLGSRARREVVNVYDLSPEKVGRFDVVLISQLLLRLRDPQTVIENMFSVTRGCAIIAEPYDPELEALSRPVSEFTGTRVMGIWWRHSIKAMRLMMEVAGFDPVEEVSRFEVTNRAGRFAKVVLKGHVPGGAHEQ